MGEIVAVETGDAFDLRIAEAAKGMTMEEAVGIVLGRAEQRIEEDADNAGDNEHEDEDEAAEGCAAYGMAGSLLAASPDLYAALHGLLQAAADVIEIHGADIWPDLAEDETPDLELWAARARAALAKAGHPA